MLPDPVVHGLWRFGLNSDCEANVLPPSSQLRVVFFSGGSRKNFFLACSHLWGELGSYGYMIGVSISFPPQGRSELPEVVHLFLAYGPFYHL